MSDQVKQIVRQTVSEMLADSMSAQNSRKTCRESSFCADSVSGNRRHSARFEH